MLKVRGAVRQTGACHVCWIREAAGCQLSIVNEHYFLISHTGQSGVSAWHTVNWEL